MQKSARSKAEERFAASESKAMKFLQDKEKARHESAERNAKLRALRLAKEAAEKEAAKLNPPAKKKASRAAS